MSVVGFKIRNHPQQVACRGVIDTVDERITPRSRGVHMKKLFLTAAFAVMLCSIAAQAATVTITGTVTDANGSAPFSVTVTTDLVTVTSASVTPSVAAAGTTRTLTVVGNSTAGQALSGAVNPSPGLTFTPVLGQPPGTFVWTFVF